MILGCSTRSFSDLLENKDNSTMVKTSIYENFKKELPRVDSKVFIIIGTTSGTCFVTSRTAAELGGEVFLLNRKTDRATKSFHLLQEYVPNGKFIQIEFGLQAFSFVQRAIHEIKSKYSKIYCLANNAGVVTTSDRATLDGYDIQIQTNHKSHFLLTKELFPLLKTEASKTGDG
jgi:NAD(P)-dependent dehydrogenase (short-subunit alcohol dehydrogenase family)